MGQTRGDDMVRMYNRPGREISEEATLPPVFRMYMSENIRGKLKTFLELSDMYEVDLQTMLDNSSYLRLNYFYRDIEGFFTSGLMTTILSKPLAISIYGTGFFDHVAYDEENDEIQFSGVNGLLFSKWVYTTTLQRDLDKFQYPKHRITWKALRFASNTYFRFFVRSEDY
jgi:hypothetical protein